MPLTPEDVRNKQFTTVRLREGYDEDEVDAFLDEVEAELTRLLRENEDLRAKLAAATRAAAQSQQQGGMRKPEPQDRQGGGPVPAAISGPVPPGQHGGPGPHGPGHGHPQQGGPGGPRNSLDGNRNGGWAGNWGGRWDGTLTGEEIRQLRSELRERIADAEALRNELQRQGVPVEDLNGVINRLRQLTGEPPLAAHDVANLAGLE